MRLTERHSEHDAFGYLTLPILEKNNLSAELSGSAKFFRPPLMGLTVFTEIPIGMILAGRLLPMRANRLANIIASIIANISANIIAGGIMTLVNGFLTFVMPPITGDRPPAYPEYFVIWVFETVLRQPPPVNVRAFLEMPLE